jgi:outer membrane biosynthesis protein TonB
MDTLVPPTPVEPELNLLTQWGDPGEADRRRKAALVTLAAHAAGIVILFMLPESFFEEHRPPDAVRHITPIFEPLTRLTQKAPNTVKAPKEFSAETHPALPRPALPAPAPAGPKLKPQPVRQAVIPQAPPPKPTQQLPEPPKVEAAVKAPKIDVPQLGTLPPPPPQIQAQENPKLPLENLNHGPPPVVPPEKRVIPIPDASPSAVLRNLGGGAPQLPPAPPVQDNEPTGVQLPQLLTDAQGVDFTPYLRLILQTVKRNWQAVMPENVRLGRRGKVSIVFSINREGRVLKLVYNEQSGIDSYDKAAVAGISMSNPFPPLPLAYKGDHIAVQFNFAYNTPKK